MPRSPSEILLKRWDDWSDGVGYQKDGQHNGYYYGYGIIGMFGELRPVPASTSITTSLNRQLLGWYQSGDQDTTGLAACAATLKASGGVIAVLGSTSEDSGAGSATLTYSHTCEAGTNVEIIVVVATPSTTADPTGVTWDGSAMTKITSDNFAGGNACSIWRLHRGSPGGVLVGDVVVTMAGATTIYSAAITFQYVDQTTPVDSSGGPTWEANGSVTTIELTGSASGAIVGVASPTLNTDALGWSGQTNFSELAAIAGTGTLGMVGSYTLITTKGPWSFQHFFEAYDTSTDSLPQLYVQRGNPLRGTFIHKVSINNADFATDRSEREGADELFFPGQPAAYGGKWYFPQGPERYLLELTTVVNGAISGDTFTAGAGSGYNSACEHLANLGSRLVGICRSSLASSVFYGGAALTTNPGARILPSGKDPLTEADWGAAFPVAERVDRALGLATSNNSIFVMMPDGLYSFTKDGTGGGGIVLEDYKYWRTQLTGVMMRSWKGGLLIPHQAGLLFYTPGELPTPVGFDSDGFSYLLPSVVPPRFTGGRWLSVFPVSEFVYGLYQPDPTSVTVLVMCGFSKTGSPTDLKWQVLEVTALNTAQLVSDVFVSTAAQPMGTTELRPTLFFQNGANLKYMILDTRGSPWRARSDTYITAATSEVFLSELVLENPMRLTRVVIYTQDMQSGDQWIVRSITENEYDGLTPVGDATNDINVGSPVIQNGRVERYFDKGRGPVSRLMLHLVWSTSVVTARVPPTIQRIEVYGEPVL